MAEINNNMDFAKINRINPKKETPAHTDNIESENSKEIKDFSNPSAEALGRSMIKTSKADSVENDVKFMLKNPDAVKRANAYCEMAEAILANEGVENPYEEATVQMDSYKNEFLSK